MDETTPSSVITSKDRRREVVKRYQGLPKISEALAREDVSPKGIRGLFTLYQQAGIEVNGQTVPGISVTYINQQGVISTKIPQIEPYGNDMVALHEATHIEQILNALENGLTPADINRTTEHDKAIAEIGAHTQALKYYNQLSWREKRMPAYKEMRAQAQEGIKTWSQKLASDQSVDELSTQELLNPYKIT